MTGRAAVLAALAAWAATAQGQVPRTVSPRLLGTVGRGDTTLVVWVIGERWASLDSLAARVSRAGGRIRHRSRFAHAVSAALRGDAIASVARAPEVRRVQPVAYFRRSAPSPQAHRECVEPAVPPCVRASVPADTLYGPGAWAFRQLNVPALHARGIRGAGVRIAMLDAGFNTLHPFMTSARVIAQRDFVNGDSVVRDQSGDPPGEMTHGTQTWSLIAANAPGRLMGVAPEAEFLLAKTEYGPTETRVEEDNWVAAVEWAESLGVDIISSSLGYLTFDDGTGYTPQQLNGDIGVTSVAADSAARRGTLVVVSAGNSGPNLRSIGTPADADSVLAVGATDSLGLLTLFSSRGPTADGRIKPEILAPGELVVVAGVDTAIARSSGTSFAAPLVAGLAALVQSARPGRRPFDVRQGVLDAGSQHLSPDNNRGYGIPDALLAYAFPSGLVTLDPTGSALATLSPTFNWSAGSPPLGVDPPTFRLVVARNATLSGAIVDTTLADTTFLLLRPPAPGTRLFWRVTASSPLGVAESTAVRGPLSVPAWATLLTLSAPGGTTTRELQPLLAWRSPAVASPPGPFTYDAAVYPASLDPSRTVASARGISDTTFRPAAPLERNLPYRWQVVAHLGSADSAITTSPGTFVVLDDRVPPATLLFQNFPNPFPNLAVGHASTCIWFDIATEGPVRLEIFDLRGRSVRRIVPSSTVPTVLAAGRYGRPTGDAPGTCDERFAWDGRDETGAPVRPGVYLYRLTAPGFRDTKRIVYLGAP